MNQCKASVHYLPDIPRQREEYGVIYWNICFIIHKIPNPEWCIRKHIANTKNF